MVKGKTVDRAQLKEWATDAARMRELKEEVREFKPKVDELEALQGKYKALGLGEYGDITVENLSPRVGTAAKGPALVSLQTLLGPIKGKEAWSAILVETVPVSVKVKDPA